MSPLQAQKQQAKPSQIPPFKVLLTNGSYFYNKDVPANKPFVVIYFAPDCDHCIVLMDDLFPRFRQLDKASVLMVTYKNPQEIIPFEKKYNTYQYPNLKVGTEGLAYNLKNFYKLERTPFMALYNKQGQLVATYNDKSPASALLAAYKTLK